MKRAIKITLLFTLIFLLCNTISFAYTDLQSTPTIFNIFSTKLSKSTPFWIKVGSTKYYFVHNKTDGQYIYSDLVGCEGEKDVLFEQFYKMDTNKDGKISTKELLDADIRLVEEKLNGKLELNNKSKDFPIENIEYIDLVYATTYSDKFARPFGTFNVYIKTERGNLKKYIGHAGYVRPRWVEEMF